MKLLEHYLKSGITAFFYNVYDRVHLNSPTADLSETIIRLLKEDVASRVILGVRGEYVWMLNPLVDDDIPNFSALSDKLKKLEQETYFYVLDLTVLSVSRVSLEDAEHVYKLKRKERDKYGKLYKEIISEFVKGGRKE